MNARTLGRINGALAILWLALSVPAMIWWRDSVAFLVFVSVYANVAGHVSAWQAARAERATESD